MAAFGEEALHALAGARADLALGDLSLPQMSGAELIAAVQTQRPDLPCLVLSGHKEAPYVEQALTAGARGYLLKGNPYELAGAIQQVLDGEVYLSGSLRRG